MTRTHTAADAAEGEVSHTVLVVDDDNVVRLLLRTQLQKAGFRVLCAADGEQALSIFEQAHPDVVLLDVMMPGLDGFAVCEAIRRNPAGANTPIVMMTGLEDLASIHRAYQAGATDFATKPVNCPVLIQRLRYMLRATVTLEALRSSQDTLKSAQKLINLGYVEFEPATGYCRLSELVRKLKQQSAGAELSDIDWLYHIMRSDDLPHLQQRLDGLPELAAGESRTWEQMLRMSDGSVRTYQVHLARVDTPQKEMRRLLATVLDITERKQSEQRIRRLAFFDQLTGLPNRVLLTEYLEGRVNQAARGQPLAVLAIDLDLFNRINNSLGQAAGDSVLRQIAKRLYGCEPFSASIPVSEWLDADPAAVDADMVARLAGDTFVAVLNHVSSIEQAVAVAKQLNEVISQPLHHGAHELFLSASIGIAWYPEGGSDAATLLRNADMAMHVAKERGRSSVQCYHAALADNVATKLSLHNDLRRALERDEFEVHFQPKLAFPEGSLAGFEALLRWNHPQRGRVPPDQFICLAEESGLIVEIGAWVLRRSCEQLRRWIDYGLPEMRLAVNMSPRQLRDPSVVELVARVLRETGLPASRLELEITEQTLMDDCESGLGVVSQLRDLGVHIALDDFGTGYSSLSYLTRFPIDSLKIDRCFVHNIASDPQKAAIVSAVTQLSRQLDIQVVAEGVETEEDLQLVSSLGCHQGQGYHICRPLPEKELIEWLKWFRVKRREERRALAS